MSFARPSSVYLAGTGSARSGPVRGGLRRIGTAVLILLSAVGAVMGGLAFDVAAGTMWVEPDLAEVPAG